MSDKRIWRFAGGELCFPPVRIMGIINCTPDSFSDGGLFLEPEAAFKRYLELAKQNISIADIGAQSTRPGSDRISAKEELDRLVPVLTMISDEKRRLLSLGKHAPFISIDTYFSSVAQAALSAGADIINDVSGAADSEMPELIAKSGCGYILTHCAELSTVTAPIEMIKAFFVQRLKEFKKVGIDPEQIALDPGIGFGKTRAQEISFLDAFESLRADNRPLLAAYSRKRVIADLMHEPDSSPLSRDAATHAAHRRAAASGADILRVHDTKGAVSVLFCT